MERFRQIDNLYRIGKSDVWEGARAFFEAAFGQRSSVIEDAFKSLPIEFHHNLSEFIMEQEQIGYECQGELIRVFFRDDVAEMEARLAKSRPLIRGTCDLLRLLLNERAEQTGTGQPATRPVVEPEGSEKSQPEAEGRSR